MWLRWANKANPSIPIASFQDNMVGKMFDNVKSDIGGAYEVSICEGVGNKVRNIEEEGSTYDRVQDFSLVSVERCN
jgi:hypothetical protein